MIARARSASPPQPETRTDRLAFPAQDEQNCHETESVATAGAQHARSGRLLGDEIHIFVGSPVSAVVDTELLDGASRFIESADAALHRADRTSELGLLNGHAGEWVRVSSILLDAIEAAVTAAQITAGLVDPSLLRALERTGYASRGRRTRASLTRALARPVVRRPGAPSAGAEWQRIQIDRGRSAVRLPRGVRLDLGGSAKAMVVDAVAAMLAPFPSVAVDAGGDIRLAGLRPAPQSIAIAHPLVGGDPLAATINAGAIATSGLGSGVWEVGCDFAHHLIDPARAAPAWTGVIQATALAPTMLEATTLAKQAFLLGPHAGLAVLERHGGIATLDNGRSITVGEVDGRVRVQGGRPGCPRPSSEPVQRLRRNGGARQSYRPGTTSSNAASLRSSNLQASTVAGSVA